MNNLWRFLGGYITILLCGTDVEQLLNSASKNRINIWGLRYSKGNITGNISVKNFKKLRLIKRGIKCRVKILKKRGFCFISQKYKKRTGFIVGLFVFLFLLNIMSQFIWIINVEGSENISKEEVLESCNELGISEGILSNRIDTKNDAERLLLIQEGLAWGSLNVEGCILTVNLTEIKASDREERKMPSNIKAAYTGVISKIDISTGNVAVKVGDLVSSGDLLVSGIIEQYGSTLFVHSAGEIFAKTEHKFTEEANFVQQINIPQEKTKIRRGVEFFGLKIPLYLGSVDGNYDSDTNIKQLSLFGKRIPITIATQKYNLLTEKTVEYTPSQLEERLYEKIENRVKKSNFEAVNEISREVIKTDNGIKLEVIYLCEENIAMQDDILIGAQN